MKGNFMKTARSRKPKMVFYRRNPGDPLTEKQKANIEALKRVPDHEINTSDIPELPASAWKDAVRGGFIVR